MLQHHRSRPSRRSPLKTLLVVGAALAVSPLFGRLMQTTWAATPTPAAGDQAVLVELQALIDGLVADTPSIPGLLVYLSVPALGLEWSGAAGVADRETGEPLVPDSTLRIASNTKTFTAAATLRLVENGALGIDQAIDALLSPESVALLADGGYDPGAILVRHLLTHTSGLYDFAEDPAYQEARGTDPTKRWTRAEQVRLAMERGQPLGAPGAVFGYSDTGYILLGEIVERASGLPLADAYRELLGFDRLGLHSTYLETLEPVPAGAAPRAHQYFGEWDTTGFDPSFDLYGGGGLVSSVDDLGRFYRALFQGQVFRDPATLETMLSAPAPAAAMGGAMGLFRRQTGGEEPCWGHGGYWGSYAFHCPGSDETFAMSWNQAELDDMDSGELLRRLVADVFAIVYGR
jgi:D-alanyl-D-alanine carboxypeptidase